MAQAEIDMLSPDDVRGLSELELQERATRLLEATQRDKDRFEQSQSQYFMFIAESRRRSEERKRAEAFEKAERFVVIQREYEEDIEDGDGWSDTGASIVPLLRERKAIIAAGFEITFGEKWIRLIIGELQYSAHGLPEVKYPVETKEIFFLTEGKDQMMYRATFFDSHEEAQAFLDQHKTPKNV